MTNNNETSPLGRLRQVVAPALSPEQEQARRQRVVARIAELQRADFRVPEAPPLQDFHEADLHVAGQAAPLRQRVRELFAARKSLTLSLAALSLMALASVVGVLAVQGFLESKAELAAADGAPAPLVAVRSGRVQLQSDVSSVLLGSGQQANADAVSTWQAESEATLVLPSAADLSLQAGSRVRIGHESRASTGQSWADRVELQRGSVSLRVPKLGAAGLSVRTADSLVEVHGTEFTVEVLEQPGGKAATRVVVSEGVVSVTSNGERQLLRAGQSWSSATAAHGAGPAAEQPTSESASSAATPSGVSAISGASSAAKGSSDLAEQNRLLQGAIEARKRGASSVAIERLEALMTRYPRSELAHNARVEHFRLLANVGQTARARQSAQAYLRQYPGGFARSEALRAAER